MTGAIPATAGEQASDDDAVAVIGMAGRFPAAAGVDQLWENLLSEVDSIHDYTDDELRAEGVPGALLSDPALVRSGGRLDGVGDFDAGYFGISDDDAAVMDPQHRLFLQEAVRALADAGCPADDPGQVIGVFAGCGPNRYALTRTLPLGLGWDSTTSVLTAPDQLAPRAAYHLNLTGPAIGVHTACSSSLVAVAVAAQHLLDFRCDVAIAGGVHVAFPFYRAVGHGTLSADGRCRTFSSDAAGYGMSSGVALVVLKRLTDALADGDRVQAVLRGWAVNNDGATRAGYAVPGMSGQAAVIAEALAAARVDSERIGYLECHGSGTPLGDAIEVGAIQQALGSFGPRAEPILLGAVKTNLGNLDAAAGVTALIKTIQVVKTGVVPANLHFRSAHPELPLAGTGLEPATRRQTIDRPGTRVAGVSSFGLGGTNAHVVVEQGPVGLTPRSVRRDPPRFAAERHWIDPVVAR